MFDHPYVMEKLMELDAQRMARVQYYRLPARSPRTNGFLRAMGRALRTAAKAWSRGAHPPEQRRRSATIAVPTRSSTDSPRYRPA